MLDIKEKKSNSCIPHFLVILSIPLVFFLAIIGSYLEFIPLKAELHSIITIGVIFFIFIFFIQHNANVSACNMRGNFHGMQNELQNEVNAHLLQIGSQEKSTVSVISFLEEYYQDLRNDNFASIATTVFPMLGILGTFVSIAISMPDFSAQSTEALDSEITLLLGGVGTAFYASIYGIFLSLWWIFFEKRGLSKIEHDSNSLVRMYDKYIWSQSELTLHSHLQDETRDENMISALKETFNLEAIQKLNDAQVQTYASMLEKTSKTFNHITENMQTVSHDLSESIKGIHHANNALQATSQIEENIRSFTQVSEELNKSVAKIDDKIVYELERSLEKIDSEVGGIIEKLGDFAEVVSEQSHGVQSSVEKYHTEVKKIIKSK